MSLSLWQQCLARLQDELPATEFSMWIRPLQAELNDNTLALMPQIVSFSTGLETSTSIISMNY
ncbi:hypothetical protein J4727_14360 [Providencia rettgeri]|uniref:DnaA N-terminal domain-containing protein n=1 Tax=Providencia rettgeri TaxID=587 RepID=A0A939NFV7_PRORE|nr:hypothetical protein [Providencia rettgeri]